MPKAARGLLLTRRILRGRPADGLGALRLSLGDEQPIQNWRGPNAEKVVRNAQCPVITIKNKIYIEKIKNIVFASNFEKVNPRLVERVSFVQNLMQAKLRIVKINTPASFTNTRYDIEQMSAFVETNIISNYTIDIHNFNNEEDGIVDFADFIEADMIMLGTHQRKGMSHFFNRSVAEDVANNSKCPVITVQLHE
jgi:K+-sensing histidine kinase KdpD